MAAEGHCEKCEMEARREREKEPSTTKTKKETGNRKQETGNGERRGNWKVSAESC